MRLYSASGYKNSSNIVVLVCQHQPILKNMILILQNGYVVRYFYQYDFYQYDFFYNLLASRHRRLHQQEILHQIDCNTGLVVVNRQDPMLDVQVLHLLLESRKIESLVNQHQDLVRPLGQVPAHLYAAVVSTAWFS